jgi:CubicO group peptidase (beta-lactamase class C family)
MVHAPIVEGSPALLWAGGLCSTVEDLLRWQRALHGGALLAAASSQAMTSPPRLEGQETTTYAYGLRVHAPRGRRVYQHSGGIDGFLAEAAYYPAEELSIVVLMNSDGGDPRSLGFELAEIVLAGPKA